MENEYRYVRGDAVLSANQVAENILSISDPEVGDIISPLKLQKLLYYVQGFNLAINEKPMFNEDILAWVHGPVVREVYSQYRDHGSNHIPPPEGIDFDIYSSEEKELIDDVYTVYGQFSAWKLRDMTHAEPPWSSTPMNQIISRQKLKDYFKTQLTDA